jgi:20S proteasome alpha/beta subunit
LNPRITPPLPWNHRITPNPSCPVNTLNFKPPRYPLVKAKNQIVTIAAGFVAQNGILLCSDSLYSGGVHIHGKKIFTHRFHTGVVTFALAGHEPFAKKAINDSCEAIRENPDYCTNLIAIRKMIEQAIKSTYEHYIDLRPIEERESSRFQLLIGIATKHQGPALFSSSGPVLTPVEHFECFGAGAYVGHHIIQNAYRDGMTLEQVATVAIHAMGAAKRYVEGVGGPSQFECIRDDGSTDTISKLFPLDLASMIDHEITHFEQEAAKFLSAVGDSQMSDEEFRRRADLFLREIEEIRSSWKKHTKHSDLFQSIRLSK